MAEPAAATRTAADRLVAIARDVQARAHAPYSHFRVGAALLAPGGEVVAGCNVENSSYGLTICAERSAIVAAVAAGFRRFVAIAIVGDAPGPLPPCGACRQVLAEFGPLDVIMEGRDGTRIVRPLADLLPLAFGSADLDAAAAAAPAQVHPTGEPAS